MVDLIVETPEGVERDYLPGPDVVIYIGPEKIEVRGLGPPLSAESIGRKIAEILLNPNERSDVGGENEAEEEVIQYPNIRTYENTIKLLDKRPELLEVLERIIQWEEVMSKKRRSVL